MGRDLGLSFGEQSCSLKQFKSGCMEMSANLTCWRIFQYHTITYLSNEAHEKRPRISLFLQLILLNTGTDQLIRAESLFECGLLIKYLNILMFNNYIKSK